MDNTPKLKNAELQKMYEEAGLSAALILVNSPYDTISISIALAALRDEVARLEKENDISRWSYLQLLWDTDLIDCNTKEYEELQTLSKELGND